MSRVFHQNRPFLSLHTTDVIPSATTGEAPQTANKKMIRRDNGFFFKEYLKSPDIIDVYLYPRSYLLPTNIKVLSQCFPSTCGENDFVLLLLEGWRPRRDLQNLLKERNSDNILQNDLKN